MWDQLNVRNVFFHLDLIDGTPLFFFGYHVKLPGTLIARPFARTEPSWAPANANAELGDTARMSVSKWTQQPSDLNHFVSRHKMNCRLALRCLSLLERFDGWYVISNMLITWYIVCCFTCFYKLLPWSIILLHVCCHSKIGFIQKTYCSIKSKNLHLCNIW